MWLAIFCVKSIRNTNKKYVFVEIYHKYTNMMTSYLVSSEKTLSGRLDISLFLRSNSLRLLS